MSEGKTDWSDSEWTVKKVRSNFVSTNGGNNYYFNTESPFSFQETKPRNCEPNYSIPTYYIPVGGTPVDIQSLRREIFFVHVNGTENLI